MHVYVLVPRRIPHPLNVARREACWLIKDRMAPVTPSAQPGFSFSASQVEAIRPQDLERELSRFRASGQLIRQVREALGASAGDSSILVVPLKKELRFGAVPSRIALSRRILSLRIEPLGGEPTEYTPDRSFWSESGSRYLPFGTESSWLERALLNINHPYQMASVWQVDRGFAVDMASGQERYPPNGSPFPIVTAVWDLDLRLPWNEVCSVLDRICTVIPPGTRLKNQPTPMNRLGIETGGLSAGSLLIRVKSHAGVVRRLLGEADARGLSIHSFYEIGECAYLGFKKHPRDEKLDDLGPPFDPDLEIRRLQQVEWARNEVRGHKGPGGDLLTRVAEIEGWEILTERGRSRFKDADDILVLLRSPDGDLSTVFEEGRPSFETIFGEAQWNLHCPRSGSLWLDTVYNLWLAEADPQSAIESAVQNLLPCTFQERLKYSRGPFLWLLHLLSIEEDINYRFFYHAFRTGPRKRKQGRDMPMNAILRIAASPRDPELPKQLAHSARRGGGLTGRPREFKGPEHLRRWFQSRLLLPLERSDSC